MINRKYGQRYPWEDWFSKGSFSLTKGRDYECQTHGMAGMIRNAANRFGKSVQVKIVDNNRIEVKVMGDVPTTEEA